MRIDVYTWQDAYVSTIGADELLSLVHTDELNGEDSVDIATTFPLRQGYRLVWSDRLGKAHEHVCQDPKGLHAGGETIYTDTALDSVCELYGDYIEDKRPHGYGFLQALNVCLEPTRWEAGAVDQPGTVDAGLTFYHTSSREALQSILKCGGELETEIAVSGGRVVSRKVCIRSHRGEKGGHRRFSYTKDLVSVSRTEHYGAITACYGYGKGVETDAGGYGRKLTFGDINNGKNYVEDAAALKLYGRPDGKGGRAHVFGQFEDSDCEDAATLLSETTAYLDAHKEPGLTYEADAVDLVQFGRGWEGVAVAAMLRPRHQARDRRARRHGARDARQHHRDHDRHLARPAAEGLEPVQALIGLGRRRVDAARIPPAGCRRAQRPVQPQRQQLHVHQLRAGDHLRLRTARCQRPLDHGQGERHAAVLAGLPHRPRLQGRRLVGLAHLRHRRRLHRRPDHRRHADGRPHQGRHHPGQDRPQLLEPRHRGLPPRTWRPTRRQGHRNN
ncbi:hypothetical protein DW029_09415 [Collinsella sp. AF38-3AC]|nr:hypothetical protein DW029_09415 [Collinsella sp. AF38-3AC]